MLQAIIAIILFSTSAFAQMHDYNEAGRLQVYSKSKLETYVDRAKDALLDCDFFEENYTEHYYILKATELEVDFIETGIITKDGHFMDFTTCGEWGGHYKPNQLYFRAVMMNRKRDNNNKGDCFWEENIPHEVLHAGRLYHIDDPNALKYNRFNIMRKDFLNILTQCRLSFDSPYMKKWWILPFENAHKVPDDYPRKSSQTDLREVVRQIERGFDE